MSMFGIVTLGVVAAMVIAAVVLLREPTSIDADEVAAAVLIVGLLYLLFAGMFAGGRMVDARACERRAAELGTEWRHGYANGCRLRLDDGRYVDEGKFRVEADQAG